MIQRLHRNYFANALLENPSDPTRSKFAKSFKATFHSSRMLLDLAAEGLKSMDNLMLRFHALWASILSSAIVFSSVLSRVKISSYAKESLDAMDKTITLFEGAKLHPIPEHSIVGWISLHFVLRLITIVYLSVLN